MKITIITSLCTKWNMNIYSCHYYLFKITLIIVSLYGIDLRFQEDYLSSINLNWLIESYNKCPEKDGFFNKFFDKLAGTDKLRLQIIDGKTSQEIKESWKVGLDEFREIRKKYLIYN